MASSDSNKYRSRFNTISKIKIDNGETQRDKEILYDKYVEKVVSMKNLTRFGDVFPDRVHKILPEELAKYNSLYFTPDPIDDTNLQIELENEFRNKEIEDRKEQLKISKELQKVKEIQEIADSGLSVPEDINPFSDEGKAYLQSEAVNYPNGFRGLVEDSKMAKEDMKQGLIMNNLEQIAEDAFDKFKKLDPTDTGLVTKLIRKEIRDKVSNVFKTNPNFGADKMEKVSKNIEKQVLQARGMLIKKTRKTRSDKGKTRKDSGEVFAGASAGMEQDEEKEIVRPILKQRKAQPKAQPKGQLGAIGKFNVF